MNKDKGEELKTMENLFLGIDVGTGSVRAGIFDRHGNLKANADHPLKIWKPRPGFVEQSSEDVWRAAAKATRRCLLSGGIRPESIKGLSFDATCSLVALGDGLEPVTISPTKNKSQNIMVWMDHRAILQAERINNTGHEVLKYVGGKISPEMEPPKLLWIKENLRPSWKEAKKFMDLADYMVYRASGADKRSLCTSVCKWTYLGHEGTSGRYRIDFFDQIGIADLFEEERVPLSAHPMGTNAGGLTKRASEDLGLLQGTPVGVGIIDAHAGGIGSLGAVSKKAKGAIGPLEQKLVLIGGTSSCHLGISLSPRFIPGIWGPYYGAMIPGAWLNEGGQSSTGSLIDFVIRNNASFGKIARQARRTGVDIYTLLNRQVQQLKKKDGLKMVADLHLLPYHHGNRSPRADPQAKGMVSGLTLSETEHEVALWYYAAIQAVAYGTRHIIETMNNKGYQIRKIHLCGGHLKNRLFIQENADITGCEIILPREPEAVLLGTAILAAVAAGEFPDISQGMESMCHGAEVVQPNQGTFPFHAAKYEIFKGMYDFQKKMKKKMENL
jgi:FGGY-family pentulose kinase